MSAGLVTGVTDGVLERAHRFYELQVPVNNFTNNCDIIVILSLVLYSL